MPDDVSCYIVKLPLELVASRDKNKHLPQTSALLIYRKDIENRKTVKEHKRALPNTDV